MVLGLVWDTVWPTHDEQPNRTWRAFELSFAARWLLGQQREPPAMRVSGQQHAFGRLRLYWLSLCEGALVSALLPFNPFDRASGSKWNVERMRVEQRTARAAAAMFCRNETRVGVPDRQWNRPLSNEMTIEARSQAAVVLQSQRDCVLQPRVAESARLPWVSARAIFNPNGVVSPVRHQDATPLGLADTARFSQGSSRLATLGFRTESLWDS